MKYSILNSGNKMPLIGFGTFTLTNSECKEAVKKAIEVGYRHIDTAEIYDNEKEVGLGIKRGMQNVGISREDIFVTSKVWKDNLQYEDVINACQQSLRDLKLDYLDLYLIHWPNKKFPMGKTFAALSQLQKEGKIKDIGVSNFTIKHLKKAQQKSDIDIAVNQIEYHPYLNQNKLLNFCQDNGIRVTAFSPLGDAKLLNEDIIKKLAKKINKSPAQLILKWLIEKDIIVIPRSTSKSHMEENLDLFNWSLPSEIFEKIEHINIFERIRDPEFGEFNI